MYIVHTYPNGDGSFMADVHEGNLTSVGEGDSELEAIIHAFRVRLDPTMQPLTARKKS